jgi:hypothetical protein
MKVGEKGKWRNSLDFSVRYGSKRIEIVNKPDFSN